MACEEGATRSNPATGLQEECIGGEWTPLPAAAAVGGPGPGVLFRIPDLAALMRLLERDDIKNALADPIKKLWVTITDDDTPPQPTPGGERPPTP
jgi:hypothetical protein